MNPITNTENNSKKLKYSYNPKITSETSKARGGQIISGWKDKETSWDEAELTEMVKTISYLPSKLIDGKKLKKNVEEVYFLTLDFDKGNPTKEKFIEEAKSSEHSWFLHTTVNHQKSVTDENVPTNPRDKFRVIVPFSRPVTLDELTNMKEEIKKKFPTVDPSSFDGNRYFKMNPNAETYLHNFLNEEGEIVFLDPTEFITEKKKSGRPKNNENEFSKILEVLLADNKTKVQISEIDVITKIFCPFCDHTKRTHPDAANAMLNINNAGQYTIFCFSEDQLYFQKPEEINASRSKLFWNESVGAPSRLDYKSYNGGGPLYIFKKDSDFENYCTQNQISLSIKNWLPRREIIFNPALPGGLNEEFYNLFEETEYMKKDYSTLPKLPLNQVIFQLQSRCTVIYEIMLNVFGETEYLEKFINWIAFILQEREKAYTAWLITSKVQGTGKDLIFDRILKPLFGENQSQLMKGSRIAKTFNKQDMNTFLRGYNEVFSAGNIRENLERKESLKDAITASYQTIEFKGVDTFQAQNFMNFILYSNNPHPIFLDEEDRRFNVIRNEKAKKVSELSIYKSLVELEPDIKKELPDFADIIFTLEYDSEIANTAFNSEAKDNLKALSRDEYAEFVERLKSKDADYFLLEEVFPITEGERAMGLKTDIAAMVEDIIDKYGVIPATYMSKICKYHFTYKNYKQNLERLKLKGLKSGSKRVGATIMKVYDAE